jgi:hypothetical protein
VEREPDLVGEVFFSFVEVEGSDVEVADVEAEAEELPELAE